MRIVHWVLASASGANAIAAAMHKLEKAAGQDSYLADTQTTPKTGPTTDLYAAADIHVCHANFPSWFKKVIKNPNHKLIWVGHCTPEHAFNSAIRESEGGTYGHNDSFMVMQHHLQISDAVVTFWPRHAAIYASLCSRGKKVFTVPMGVDKTIWLPVPTRGKWAGDPSLFTAENSRHTIKSPLDLFIIWPWVYPRITNKSPCMHVSNVAHEYHRYYFPLVNMNGASYGCHISPRVWPQSELQNIFNSIDYYIGLVRYGDHNMLNLEAAACGTKTISFKGNEYADFWLSEGDQRTMADELVAILNGQVQPRTDKLPAPSAEDMMSAMMDVYAKVSN